MFQHEEYNKIQKVYSIWICPDPLKRNQNSIIEYGITPQKIVGAARPSDYDLLKLVIINLNDDGMEDTQGIIRLLSTLLSVQETPEEKKRILSEEFHISMEKELEEEMKEMCNLSDGVMELGRAEGALETLISLIKKGRLTVKEGAEEVGMTVDEFEKKTGLKAAMG